MIIIHIDASCPSVFLYFQCSWQCLMDGEWLRDKCQEPCLCNRFACKMIVIQLFSNQEVNSSSLENWSSRESILNVPKDNLSWSLYPGDLWLLRKCYPYICSSQQTNKQRDKLVYQAFWCHLDPPNSTIDKHYSRFIYE